MVSCGTGDTVYGVGNPHALVKGKANYRQAHLSGTVHFKIRTAQMGFIIGKEAGCPGQMRILQQ